MLAGRNGDHSGVGSGERRTLSLMASLGAMIVRGGGGDSFSVLVWAIMQGLPLIIVIWVLHTHITC